MNIYLLKQSKFRYIILSVVLLVSSLFSACTRRTPEKAVEDLFNISLIGFDYTIESYEEQCYPNGDGSLDLVIKFNHLTPQNIAYLKKQCHNQSVLASEKLGKKIPAFLLKMGNVYYLYDYDKKEPNNFKVFIFDEKKKNAVVYVRIS